MYVILSHHHTVVLAPSLMIEVIEDALKADVRGNQVCGTQTSRAMLISRNDITPNKNRVGLQACERGLGSSATVQNFKLCACLLNPPYSHSGKWGLGISALPLVSALQTRSSQTLAFNPLKTILFLTCISHRSHPQVNSGKVFNGLRCEEPMLHPFRPLIGWYKIIYTGEDCD